MRFKYLGILAGALSLGMAQTAYAADMPVKAPFVKAVPYNWTGLYIGVNAGYGANKQTGDSLCTNPAGVVNGLGCNLPNNGIVTPKGGLVGAQIGYNFQSGAVVYGVETDIQWSGIKASGSVPDSFAPGIYNASANLQWFGTLRARLGLAVLDRGLIYGTGGLIYGHESVSALLTYPLINYPQSGSTTRAGWTLGGGFEYAFTQNLSGKFEGLYYDMGSQTIAYTAPVGLYTESTTFSYKGAIVRVGLNWKFM